MRVSIVHDGPTSAVTRHEGRTPESIARTVFGRNTTAVEMYPGEWEIVERTPAGAWRAVHYLTVED